MSGINSRGEQIRVLPKYCSKCGKALQVNREASFTGSSYYEYLRCPRYGTLWIMFGQVGHSNVFVGEYDSPAYDPMTGEKID